MSDFKYHIGSKFGACKLVAVGLDPHRQREVRLYHLPGNFNYVGINDGVDCFIAPASIDPFSKGIARLFADIRAGKEIVVEQLAKPRRVVSAQRELPLGSPEPAARPRRVVAAVPVALQAQINCQGVSRARR